MAKKNSKPDTAHAATNFTMRLRSSARSTPTPVQQDAVTQVPEAVNETAQNDNVTDTASENLAVVNHPPVDISTGAAGVSLDKDSWIDARELYHLLLDVDCTTGDAQRLHQLLSAIIPSVMLDSRVATDGAPSETVLEALEGKRVILHNYNDKHWIRNRRRMLASTNNKGLFFSYNPLTLASDCASNAVRALRDKWLEKVTNSTRSTLKNLILGLPGTANDINSFLTPHLHMDVIRYVFSEYVCTFLSCAPDVDLSAAGDWQLTIWKYVSKLPDARAELSNKKLLETPERAINWGVETSKATYSFTAHENALSHSYTTLDTLDDDLYTLKRTLPELAACAYMRCVFRLSNRKFQKDLIIMRISYKSLRDNYVQAPHYILPMNRSQERLHEAENEHKWLSRVNLSMPKDCLNLPVFFENTFMDKGDSVNALVNYVRFVHTAINWLPSGGNGYKYPVFTMVQSAGWGKTRLVYEMREKLPTVYICLRGKEDTDFPQVSPLISEHLLCKKEIRDYQILFLRILVAYYAAIRYSDTDSWQAASDLMMLTFCTNSIAFRDSQRVNMTLSTDGLYNAYSAESFWHFVLNNLSRSFLLEIFTGLPNCDEIVNTVWKCISGNGFDFDAIDLLESAIKAKWKHGKGPKSSPFPMVIAIDKAACLLSANYFRSPLPYFRKEDNERYMNIHTALLSFKSCFVGCFIDTNSNITIKIPPLVYPISHLVDNTHVFYPFYSTLFSGIPKLHRELGTYRIVAQSIDGDMVHFNPFEMVLYSRPFFLGTAEYNAKRRMESGCHIGRIMSLLSTIALENMTNANSQTLNQVSDPFRIISVFAARFTVCPNDQMLCKQMVSRAMATVQYFNKAHDITQIMHAPEPMLALGAVKAMTTPDVFTSYLDRLTKFIASGIVRTIANPSDYSELVASIIIGRAIDINLSNHKITSNDPPYNEFMTPGDSTDLSGTIRYTNSKDLDYVDFNRKITHELPTTLHAMLKGMFSSEYIPNIIEASQSSAQLKSLFTKGWLWPLQFVHLPRPIRKNDSILADAWRRRFAIVTSQGYGGCEIIVPIKIVDTNTTQIQTLLIVKAVSHDCPVRNRKLYGYVRSVHATARKLVPTGAIACMVLQLGVGGIEGRSETQSTDSAEHSSTNRVWVNRVMMPLHRNDVTKADAPVDDDDKEDTDAAQEGSVRTNVPRGNIERRQYRETSSNVIDPEMLLITAHTVDNETFGPCVSEQDCNNMRQIINTPDELAMQVNHVMRAQGFDEKSAKAFLKLRYRGVEPKALRSSARDTPIARANESRYYISKHHENYYEL